MYDEFVLAGELALEARTTVWTTLLQGESERWTSIEDLRNLYRKAVFPRRPLRQILVSVSRGASMHSAMPAAHQARLLA